MYHTKKAVCMIPITLRGFEHYTLFHRFQDSEYFSIPPPFRVFQDQVDPTPVGDIFNNSAYTFHCQGIFQEIQSLLIFAIIICKKLYSPLRFAWGTRLRCAFLCMTLFILYMQNSG